MKNTIIGIAVGIYVALLAFNIWFLIGLSNQTTRNTQAIGEVVNFINKGIEQQKTQGSVDTVIASHNEMAAATTARFLFPGW